MNLRFLWDYTGRETAMKQYKAGDVDDIPTAQALELVRLGVAEEVYQSVQVEPAKQRKGKAK